MQNAINLSFFGDSTLLRSSKIKGGFDVVIANPPYVRMEIIKDLKARPYTNYPP